MNFRHDKPHHCYVWIDQNDEREGWNHKSFTIPLFLSWFYVIFMVSVLSLAVLGNMYKFIMTFLSSVWGISWKSSYLQTFTLWDYVFFSFSLDIGAFNEETSCYEIQLSRTFLLQAQYKYSFSIPLNLHVFYIYILCENVACSICVSLN